jgi:hypothetical protein
VRLGLELRGLGLGVGIAERTAATAPAPSRGWRSYSRAGVVRGNGKVSKQLVGVYPMAGITPAAGSVARGRWDAACSLQGQATRERAPYKTRLVTGC